MHVYFLIGLRTRAWALFRCLLSAMVSVHFPTSLAIIEMLCVIISHSIYLPIKVVIYLFITA